MRSYQQGATRVTNDAFPAKPTPLVQRHQALGARMIDFAGFWLPVQYTSVLSECRAVREAAGIFDLSHMGEFSFSGPDALANLQRLLTNDAARLGPGRAQYTLLCNEKGGVVDDVILYRLSGDEYLMVVNAANIEKDRAWIQERLSGRVAFRDRSDETALIAVQGPRAEACVRLLAGEEPARLQPFQACAARVDGVEILFSRTGYTGEDGFELYLDPAAAPAIWDRLLGLGQPLGMLPAGLGARDTLRLEAGFPLYGSELTEEISPLAAGLSLRSSWRRATLPAGKPCFGRERGSRLKLVRFEMTERGVPRSGYPLWHDGIQVGWVTSGAFPRLGERYWDGVRTTGASRNRQPWKSRSGGS